MKRTEGFGAKKLGFHLRELFGQGIIGRKMIGLKYLIQDAVRQDVLDKDLTDVAFFDVFTDGILKRELDLFQFLLDGGFMLLKRASQMGQKIRYLFNQAVR